MSLFNFFREDKELQLMLSLKNEILDAITKGDKQIMDKLDQIIANQTIELADADAIKAELAGMAALIADLKANPPTQPEDPRLATVLDNSSKLVTAFGALLPATAPPATVPPTPAVPAP